jgi:hypothetical protein
MSSYIYIAVKANPDVLEKFQGQNRNQCFETIQTLWNFTIVKESHKYFETLKMW